MRGELGGKESPEGAVKWTQTKCVEYFYRKEESRTQEPAKQFSHREEGMKEKPPTTLVGEL